MLSISLSFVVSSTFERTFFLSAVLNVPTNVIWVKKNVIKDTCCKENPITKSSLFSFVVSINLNLYLVITPFKKHGGWL